MAPLFIFAPHYPSDFVIANRTWHKTDPAGLQLFWFPSYLIWVLSLLNFSINIGLVCFLISHCMSTRGKDNPTCVTQTADTARPFSVLGKPFLFRENRPNLSSAHKFSWFPSYVSCPSSFLEKYPMFSSLHIFSSYVFFYFSSYTYCRRTIHHPTPCMRPSLSKT